MEQRSPEWFAARLGKVTASRFADVMAKGKGSAPSETRRKYILEIVSELLTGQQADSFTNPAMQWGVEWEDKARQAYEEETGEIVHEVGFIPHPAFPEISGASPDGVMRECGAVVGNLEIKCPNTSTHLDTLATRQPPSRYKYQIQWQMACTGAKWCDFVSYDPRLPEVLRLFVCRVERDDALISSMEAALIEFNGEVVDMLKLLSTGDMLDAAK